VQKRSGAGALAAVALALLVSGCGSVSVKENPVPTVVNEQFTAKEVANSRQLRNIQFGSMTLERNPGELLVVRVTGVYSARYEEWRDWSLAYEREGSEDADLFGCSLLIVFSPLGIILDADKYGEDMQRNCTGETKQWSPRVVHAPDAPKATGKVFAKEVQAGYSGPLTLQVDGNTSVPLAAREGMAVIPVDELIRRYGKGNLALVVRSVELENPSIISSTLAVLRDTAAQAELARQQEALDRQQAELAQQTAAALQALQDPGDDATPAPQQRDPDANLQGSFAQAFVQMKTGNSGLAAQAARSMGADEDVIAANTQQTVRNQATQQAAQEKLAQIQSQQQQLQREQQELQRRQQELSQRRIALAPAAGSNAATAGPRAPAPVPTREWCASHPGSGNPSCAGVAGPAAGVGSAVAASPVASSPKLVSGLDRSSCVREVFESGNRMLRNDCAVPVNVAYCSIGPESDSQKCTAYPDPTVPGGAWLAKSTINRLRPGGTASNPSVVSPRNTLAFVACEAGPEGEVSVQAALLSAIPPRGVCIRY